ncbi:hypothetical protein EXU57_23215 [Segetibacter sp. 3557_3]|uniref:hypothetical protein n=1 Tax=Segetibacter sp. 3557_3 TaxID=2547429 RepID=UPI0010585393|nr:hypothetical protein [Segetibacter sp. 3557_3]TDH18510.1 hypothetical protein EXU57_23215 [Segetibacter sp. 3557_3]
MGDLSKLLKNAPAHSINNVLSLLFHLRNAEVKTIPAVTLSTRTGNFSGYLIAYDDQNGSLLLQGLNNRQVNLTYLQAKAVVAITLNELPETPELLKFVGGKKYSGIAFAEPVSKLAFRRYVADQQATLSEGLGKAMTVEVNGLFTESVTECGGLKYMVENIFRVITGMLDEPLAKEALKTKVKEILFVVGNILEVQLTDQRLIVTLPATRDAANVDVAEFTRKIEDVL